MQGLSRVVVTSLVAVCLLHTAAASAQRHRAPHAAAPTDAPSQVAPPDESLDQAARLIFESARAAFESADYETALARFQQAYTASPRPALLFNIASALDRLRRDDEALATFERYLAAAPDVDNRVEVETRVRLLRAAIDARAHAASGDASTVANPVEVAPPAADPVAPPPVVEHGIPTDEPGGLSAVPFFVSGGAAVVCGALGVWAGLSTLSLNHDYVAYGATPGATQEHAKQLFDDASSRQLLANIFLGGAAVFGVVTVVLSFLTDWGGTDAAASTPAQAANTPLLFLDAHGAVVGLDHRF